MRIVHEIYGNVQVGGSGRPFGPTAESDDYCGGYVELIASARGLLTDAEESLYIEGSLDAVRDLARQLAQFCDAVDDDMRKAHKAQRAGRAPKGARRR